MTTKEYCIGVVGGLKLPINVKNLLRNLRRLLEEHEIEFNLQLVARDEDARDLDGYEVFDPGFTPPSRALDMVTDVTKGLIKYVKKHDPDVLLQVTEFSSHGSAATIAGKLSGTPVITRIAGDDFNEYRFSTGVSRMKVFAMRNILGRVPLHLSDKIVVLGPHVEQEVKSRASGSDVLCLPQPIDSTQFHPLTPEKRDDLRDQLGLNASKRIFLSVGRLSPRKGMDNVARAAKELNNRDEEFTWLVIGTGDLQGKLESIDNVRVLGKVAHDEIERYFQVADLFVHASRIDGLPNVLLEASACGTPSISRDIGECSTIATRVYESDTELTPLLLNGYDRVDLPDKFSDEKQRAEYANLLITAAESSK